ncbi:hypothetical protein [Kitasatospora sp. NPDC002965]|uniref:hypothetical protein n=1 Tax=Kitasatospora sp. NPDC002965 TaxID=3154775 RepID=UPI0033A47E21
MPPDWLRFGREPRATAYVVLEHPPTERQAVESWCREAAAWARHGGGEAHLATGAVLQHDRSADIAQHFARSLAHSSTATLTYLDHAGPSAGRVWVQPDGLAVY